MRFSEVLLLGEIFADPAVEEGREEKGVENVLPRETPIIFNNLSCARRSRWKKPLRLEITIRLCFLQSNLFLFPLDSHKEEHGEGPSDSFNVDCASSPAFDVHSIPLIF